MKLLRLLREIDNPKLIPGYGHTYDLSPLRKAYPLDTFLLNLPKRGKFLKASQQLKNDIYSVAAFLIDPIVGLFGYKSYGTGSQAWKPFRLYKNTNPDGK